MREKVDLKVRVLPTLLPSITMIYSTSSLDDVDDTETRPASTETRTAAASEATSCRRGRRRSRGRRGASSPSSSSSSTKAFCVANALVVLLAAAAAAAGTTSVGTPSATADAVAASSASSSCVPGWTGPNCETCSVTEATHDDEVVVLPCRNGGRCVPVLAAGDSGAAACDCSTAYDDLYRYVGKYCHVPLLRNCVESNDHHNHDNNNNENVPDSQTRIAAMCLNGGVCSDGGGGGSGTWRSGALQPCDCPSGFGGPYCQYDLSSETNRRQTEQRPIIKQCTLQCGTDGTCSFYGKDDDDDTGSLQQYCACRDGYIGDRCQHRTCDVTCMNGSRCRRFDASGGGDDGGSYGYGCDCAQSTAKHLTAGIACQFAATDDCRDATVRDIVSTGASVPPLLLAAEHNRGFCVNGGTCYKTTKEENNSDTHYCECTAGFEGPHCEFFSRQAAATARRKLNDLLEAEDGGTPTPVAAPSDNTVGTAEVAPSPTGGSDAEPQVLSYVPTQSWYPTTTHRPSTTWYPTSTFKPSTTWHPTTTSHPTGTHIPKTSPKPSSWIGRSHPPSEPPTGSEPPTLTAFPTIYEAEPTFHPLTPHEQKTTEPAVEPGKQSAPEPWFDIGDNNETLNGGTIFAIVVAVVLVGLATYCCVCRKRRKQRAAIDRNRNRVSELELAESSQYQDDVDPYNPSELI